MANTAPLLIGYARVSTDDQNLDAQRDALIGHGVGESRIFSDQASGGSMTGRPGLTAAIRALRAGDVLVVWSLDRLGRNLGELILTLQRIEDRRANLRCLTQPIDTSSPMGKLVFNIVGAMAQFEREVGVERTKAGLAAAAARGRKGGRKPALTEEKAAQASKLLAERLPPKQIAAAVGVSASTIHKWKRSLEGAPPVHDPLTDEVTTNA